MNSGPGVTFVTRIPVRAVIGFLALSIAFLTLLSMAGEFIIFFVNHGKMMMSIDRMIDLNFEANLPTWFSSALLLLAGLLLVQCGQIEKRRGSRLVRYWMGLAWIFVFLSADETAQFHERSIKPLREWLHAGGLLYFTWVIPGIIFTAIVGLWSLKFLAGLDKKTRYRFVFSGFVYTSGSLFMEMIDGDWAFHHGMDIIYYMMTDLEETLEMVGVLLFIWSILKFLEQSQMQARVQVQGEAQSQPAEVRLKSAPIL